MGIGENTWLGYIMSIIAVCGSEQGQKLGIALSSSCVTDRHHVLGMNKNTCKTQHKAMSKIQEKHEKMRHSIAKTDQHASSCIIMHHHASSCTIMHHHASSCIMHHHASCTTMHHASCIMHHHMHHGVCMHYIVCRRGLSKK